MIGTTRKAIVIPAAGATDVYDFIGVSICVELSPENEVLTVPVLRIGGDKGAPLPAYSQSQYVFPEGFKRVGIEGTTASAGLTLYLLIINSCGVDVSMPGTVVAP